MKYLSLFSGIGGFELGIQKAYERSSTTNKKERVQGIGDTEGQSIERPHLGTDGLTCVGYSEIDKYAIQIYQRHFPEHKNYGDITQINTQELPDFELLCGGFPCQAFSIAGKRGGFNDTRGTLFFEIARILKDKQPNLLFLENVKGLLSHDEGRTFRTIISTLDELGYDLQWQVLNSKNFGVPQNRERVFIVGHLRGTSRPKVFPIGEGGQTNSGERIKGDAVSCIDASYWKGPDGKRTMIKEVYASTQENNAREVLRVLQDEIGKEAFAKWGLGILDSLQKEEVLREVLHGESVRVQAEEGESTVDDSTLSRKEDMPESSLLLLWKREDGSSPQRPRLAEQFIGELSESLSQLSQPDTSWRIRRLTPTEAERLQGFPDGWTEGVSDTQRYKTLGNAVTVNVIREIMSKI